MKQTNSSMPRILLTTLLAALPATSSAEHTAENAGTSAAASTRAIWRPGPGLTWQWQLQGALDTSFDVDVYDVDLFDVSAGQIDALRASGHKVICYFSAGSYEEGRPDAATLEQTGLGNPLDGWPGERWLDVRSPAVREVMLARLDLAVTKHCDAVEPDNVDAYDEDNDSGLDITTDDQLDFNRFLASAAHARDLSVGLKNALALVPALVGEFDWALNEQCVQYGECEELAPFVEAGKAVFHTEYDDDPEVGGINPDEVCESAPAGFSTIIKHLELDTYRIACR